jgi:hypothetical protein
MTAVMQTPEVRMELENRKPFDRPAILPAVVRRRKQ